MLRISVWIGLQIEFQQANNSQSQSKSFDTPALQVFLLMYNNIISRSDFFSTLFLEDLFFWCIYHIFPFHLFPPQVNSGSLGFLSSLSWLHRMKRVIINDILKKPIYCLSGEFSSTQCHGREESRDVQNVWWNLFFSGGGSVPRCHYWKCDQHCGCSTHLTGAGWGKNKLKIIFTTNKL